VERPAGGSALTALADSNQLQQALVNLALNARDALTSPAPILFHLERKVVGGELPGFPDNVAAGDYVVLNVVDTGKGMTPEVLNQALDPFFTTKGVGQGTGLGLPMVFGIVHGHHGYLTIDSKPVGGTSVSIYLPRLAEPLTPEERARPFAEFESGQVLEPENVPGRNILVVDDEAAVLDVVRRFLEIAGHHVFCAVTGEEALDVLRDGRAVDLIILDLMMPGEEEAPTFHKLRQRLPAVPILLCTGLLQPDPASRLLQAGAAGILRKPFRMTELWYAVDQALGGVAK
jgi:CheY-like chemotaxis protein